MFIVLYRNAARIHPPAHEIRYIHRKLIDFPPRIRSKTCGPNATAGLNTPHDKPPTLATPTMTMKPIARPKYEFHSVALVIATLRTV